MKDNIYYYINNSKKIYIFLINNNKIDKQIIT